MEATNNEEREYLLPNLKPRHKELVPTPCGPIKQCSELTQLEKIYILVANLSLLVVLGITIASIAQQTQAESGDSNHEDISISIIQLLGVVFSIYYVLRGVLQENRQELLVFSLSVLLVLVRSLVNFIAAEPEENKLVKIRFGCIVACGLFLITFTVGYLIKSPRLMAFRVGGALESAQTHYLTLTLCFSVVTFDLQAQLCLCVLLGAGSQQLSLPHTIILGLGIFWALLKAAIGLGAILKENKPLVRIFLVQNLPELAYLGYLIYLISVVWLDRESVVLKAGAGSGIIFSIIIKLALLWLMVKVSHYFGHSDQERMFAVASSYP
ncbi:uncharacterized protein [Narcine bancroftii]|uniref:uncharacterized protein isoform X2 n=1 Tax=Narcine bancroftii TaxID=1343680 RepID=UPI0038316EF5